MVRVAVACTVILGCIPATAGARAHRRVPLWATVNVCDTTRHPDAIGVRASMPGTGVSHQRMFMRFRVQWHDPADRLWHNLVPPLMSRWVPVGSARYAARQTGRIFRFQAPAAGRRQVLRGAVSFQWRRGRKVVRRASRYTEAGHRSAAGSDPRGHSAATCVLKHPR